MAISIPQRQKKLRSNIMRPVVSLSLLLVISLIGVTGCGSDNARSSDSHNVTDTPDSASLYNAQNPAHVLLLHSYHAENLWDQELDRGILAGLAESGYSQAEGNLVLDYFWMDTKRHNDPVYMGQIGADAMAYIRAEQPDVVLATDNNAIRLVVAPWSDESIPFVYAGLNDNPRNYHLPDKKNVTGVLERVHIAEMLRWIEWVLPEARRIIFLADASETTTAYTPEVMMQVSGSGNFTVESYHVTNSFAEWQAYMLEMAQNGDILMVGTYQTVRDANQVVMDGAEVMAWTIENSPVPVIPMWEFGVQQGALGGPVISGETQGYEAALKVARILNGEKPGDIPVTVPKRGKLTINVDAAQRWNIVFPMELIETSVLYQADGTIVSRTTE
jgi:ABC-type uncharacterized transport system substrate-binding protein